MKRYFIFGCLAGFIVVFNAGYVFHEIAMGAFFRSTIGSLQREAYIIPLIALAFALYAIFQAYFLHVYYTYAHQYYRWSIYKTALIFGAIVGFFWDGLQGGIIEVATFKMPVIVFFADSSYHVIEGVVMALILAFFYDKYVIKAVTTGKSV